MNKTLATTVLSILALAIISPTAQAQFWPGYGYFGGYGAWGAYSAGMENAVTRNVYAQDQMAGQLAASRQMASMQSNIRNTLDTQAQMRSQAINNQQQSNRDWWFQVQQQQMAQQRAMPSGGGSASAEALVAAAEMVKQPTETQYKADTDIIRWPPILCETQFAAQRAIVEAPYRREPNGKANPTVEDYQNMIKATDQMKAMLSDMASEISAQVYLQTEKFLNQLAAEARERIDNNKK